MARIPSAVQYEVPRTYWTFCPVTPSIYPVVVVAESDHCIWLKPEKEYGPTGRPFRPVQRQKRALPTFHSFHEALHELLEMLSIRAAAQKNGLAKLEAVYEKAAALQPPAEVAA
jgi:hypothetical protein